jgi:alanyl-tRNA synthetase
VIQTQLKGLDRDAQEIPDSDLFTLNDSHGLAPDIAVALARQGGWVHASLRTGFSAEMAERHAQLAKEAAKVNTEANSLLDVSSFSPTVCAYYDDVYLSTMDSEVQGCIEISDIGPKGSTHGVVLSSTLLYPEGGGQEGDRGTLVQGDLTLNVLDTQKVGDVIVHFTDGAVAVDSTVSCRVDWKRRKQLMDHHTAVHIVGGAARHLLGPHIFQAGSHLSTESGRLDITHFHRLSRSQLDQMEDMANEVLSSVRSTEKSELNRKDADLIHGFDLYQGGAPKGDSIRILKIADHDTQACGGTHHDEPGQIGSIRIVRSSAVQDGVERLHVVAGEAALAYARAQDEIIRSSSEVFGVHSEDLPKAASRFFKEWKDQRKLIEQLESEIVRLRTSGGGDAATEVDGVRIIIMEIDGDLKSMTTMLKELTLDSAQPTLAVLGSKDGGGKLMIGITEGTVASERYNAVDLLRSISHHIKGGGGGRPTFAQGGGSHAEGLTDALDAARNDLGV